MHSQTRKCFVGVDVGTGSTRAGVFDSEGKLLGMGTCGISTRQPCPGHFEQSSQEIWEACCSSVREALSEAEAAGSDALHVVGVSFDATCSLVVTNAAVGGDLPDDPDKPHHLGDLTYDIILWCDHRATQEAQMINDAGHQLLQFVGGQVSPEMEMPKLAWLKRFKPKTLASATRIYDLADYLLHRAADFRSTRGSSAGVRSFCTVVCKWNFNAAERGWDAEFFQSAQLSDLPFSKIGTAADVQDVGSAVSGGLGERAAQELGLPAGTVLGVGAIDAHAGGIGCLGVGATVPLEERLALIAGTSACHMASSSLAIKIPGIWGPYDSAMIPGLFLNEAGQTAAGAALDFIIESHAAYPELQAQATAASCSTYEILNRKVNSLAQQKGLQHASILSRGLFVGPDFSGNRSPLADPHLRGSFLGLGPAGDAKRAASLEALSVLYLATIQALAYSSRSIVAEINSARGKAGVASISAIHVCGGLAQNALYMQEHANVLNLPLYCTKCPNADVIRGSAMLAATAAGEFDSVAEAMSSMQQPGLTVQPHQDSKVQQFHSARYQIFIRMQRHLQEYQSLEAAALE